MDPNIRQINDMITYEDFTDGNYVIRYMILA